MDAILYIRFANSLGFSITGYRWTSSPRTVISGLLLSPVLSSKNDISRKNAILAILGHFWAWPLCATFWISILKLSYATFPLIKFIFPAPWPQWLPRGSNLRVAKLSFLNNKIQKKLKVGHVIAPIQNGLGPNFWWFSETSNHALTRCRHNFYPTLFFNCVIWAWKCNILAKNRKNLATIDDVIMTS